STIPQLVNAWSIGTTTAVGNAPILSIDGANGRVGIGTAAPSSKLEIFTSGSQTGFSGWGLEVMTNAESGLAVSSNYGGTLLGLYDGSTSRFHVLRTGNVGIGTTTPISLLQIAGTRASTTISDTSAGTNLKHWSLSSQGGNFYIATTSDSYATSSISRLTLTSTGLVGIGTSSPSQELSIQGNAYLTGGLGVGRATTTAGVIETTGVINVQGAGTSSFSNGINLADGCFATRGTCAALGGPATTFSVAGNAYLDSNVITFASSSAASLTLAFQKSATSTIPQLVNAWSIATSTTATATISIDGLNGRVGIRTMSPGAQLDIATSLATTPTLRLFGISGQTSSVFSIMHDAPGVGSEQLTISRYGGIDLKSNGSITSTGAGSTARINVTPLSTGYKGIVVRQVSGGTLPLFEWQNSAGTALGVIDGSGNLGIGTTSPWARLSIAATSTATLDNQNLFAISTSTASATSTAFIIDANGKVGIGTSSPSQQLSVTGNTYLTGGLGVGRATTTSGVIETTGVINVQGAGTSSFTNGIALANGCFLMPTGVCAGGIGGGSPVNSGTANRLAYYSSASTIDSANFLGVDATNLRLGIGTTTPATTLSVAGNTYLDSNIITIASSSAATTTVVLGNGLNFDSNTFVIDPNSNNVGIGTAAPESKLHIFNSDVARAPSASTLLFLESAGQANIEIVSGTASYGVLAFSDSGGNGRGQIAYNHNGDYLTFETNSVADRMVITSSGLVGIGSTTPASALGVAGSGYFAGNVNLDQFSTYKLNGLTVLSATTTTFNTLAGFYAGANIVSTSTDDTSGIYNTALGYEALRYATSTDGNTAVGYQALRMSSSASARNSGFYNSAFGRSALTSNTVGDSNSAFGYLALSSNTTGSQNSALGRGALDNNTTGSNNSAIGYYPLQANITGSNNTALGYTALYYNNSATNTVAVGYQAARGTAAYNNQGGTYLGYQAGYSAGTGSDYNTLLGYQAGYGIMFFTVPVYTTGRLFQQHPS
ncbi:MAG: hypothetical protein UY61_C0081G0001, partial [Candidatus Adlerbacteria bacterium GW2011_GWC1_50_9]